MERFKAAGLHSIYNYSDIISRNSFKCLLYVGDFKTSINDGQIVILKEAFVTYL